MLNIKNRAICAGICVCLISILSILIAIKVSMAHSSEVVITSTRYVARSLGCGGSSPCYSTIQEAVSASQSGDAIKVAAGIYTATAFEVIYIDKTVKLSGGYTLTDWTNSYPITQATVLDAENVSRRRGVTINNTNQNNIELFGLTIQHGRAENMSGGGVYIAVGSVVISNCQITDNTSTGLYTGGGIYLKEGSINISQSVIRNNSSYSGGGIFIESGTATIRSTKILSNSAAYGGGINIYDGLVAITENEINFNFSESGGGVYVRNGTVTFNNNAIGNNRAIGSINGDSGAGVLIQNGNILFTTNIIEGNNATSQGGGIAVINGQSILTNNVIQNNTSNSSGGGLAVSGGNITVTTSTVESNRATSGGGILIYRDGKAYLSRNTIVNNTATNGTGGGLYVLDNGISVLNANSVQFNSASVAGGGISIWKQGYLDGQNDIVANNISPFEAVYVFGGSLNARNWTLVNNGKYAVTTNTDDSSAFILNSMVISHTDGALYGSKISADHILIFDSGASCSGGASCTNILTGDPKFKNAQGYDYHITFDSYAFDAGVDIAVFSDVDSDSRPQCLRIDIGADELVPPEQGASWCMTPTPTPTLTPSPTLTSTPSPMPTSSPIPTLTPTLTSLVPSSTPTSTPTSLAQSTYLIYLPLATRT